MIETEKNENLTAARELRPSLAQLWEWLGDIPDPEIPVITITDLGIVRDVAWSADDPDECIVTVTPTYTGCPATAVIAEQIRKELQCHGVQRVRLQVQLSPAWTSDWLTEKAKQNLREYGIAPPVGLAANSSGLIVLGGDAPAMIMRCPRCGSEKTELISQFGSTPCKSLHRCSDCLEPFDYFKCH
jgi:ring-1,2-phenylacetyl-CoA epoxidase subunit PaaD